MADVESATLLQEDVIEQKEKLHNITIGRCRLHCTPFRKSVLVLLFPPLLIGLGLVIYLYWRAGLNGFPHIDIVSLAGSKEEPNLGIFLHPEDHISRESTTQRFSWTVNKSLLIPDGVAKHVFRINDEFPGPTIEARSGDVLEIEVLNLSRENISMHWHGLHMRGANEMDGPVGLTQCAIPPGKRFLYRVPVGDQTGTFWYHAHSEAQRGDGLYGGLVVHNPSSTILSRKHNNFEYDQELLLMVGDWYHLQSGDVLAKFMNYKSEGFEPCPDSLLINGVGKFECSNAILSQPVDCKEITKPRFWLNKRLRYRLRVVNVGSMTGITLRIPDAILQVITVDGGIPVEAQPAASVGVLYPAERVDTILSWEKEAADTDTIVRVELDDEYFMEPNHALEPVQSFAISPKTTHEPSSVGVSEAPTSFSLGNLKGATLAEPLPKPNHKFMIWSVVEVLDHNHGIPQGVVNRTSWQPQSTPLLALPRTEWDEHQLVPWTGALNSWVELTINNIDGTGHPFHLHGHDFYVIGSHGGNGGWDYYNPFNDAEPRGGPFNLVNPLKKDTVYVPAYGYVVVRFHADHEGIWALHCHIMWHQASGMSMAFQVLGDEMKAFSESASGTRARETCAALR